MASITVQLMTICTGGEHLSFAVSGAATDEIRTSLDEVTSVLSEEDRVAFVKALIKLAKIGRTNAQLRTLLQSGVTVTV